MNGKIYLENPYLKDLKGKIIKKTKQNNKYHVILNRTIFYPRHLETNLIDEGTLNGRRVIDVFEEKDKVIHVLEEDLDSKDIDIEIDWNRRFDFMQQHTGQHILSAAIRNLCGSNTLDVKLEDDYSYIVIDFKNLNNSDINRIERYANHIIYSNFQIKSKEEVTKGKVKRVVSIDNINTVRCEGLHCTSTGEVGIVKVIDFEKNQEDHMVIRFVCGDRALTDYTSKDELIKNMVDILSVKENDLCEKIKEILESSGNFKE